MGLVQPITGTRLEIVRGVEYVMRLFLLVGSVNTTNVINPGQLSAICTKSTISRFHV